MRLTISIAAMGACEATVPYTLLGFLLRRRGSSDFLSPSSSSGACSSPAAYGGYRFLADYASRATSAFLWISLILVTSLLVRKLAALVSLWSKGSKIPGPPFLSFFVPHSSLITRCGSSRDLTGYLSELHQKYGPIVRLWMGPSQLLVSVTDVTIIKEMLMKAKDKLPLTSRAFCLAFGRSNIFGSSFEKVQEDRESLTAFLNEKLLERGDTVSLKVAECVLERVESIISKGILDCKTISQHMSFYILGVALFEEAFLNWSDTALYEELLLKIAKDACFWASYKVPPFWKREYWRYQFLCTRLKHLTQDIIQQSGYSYDTLSQLDQNPYKESKSTGKKLGNDATVFPGNTISRDIVSKGQAEGYHFLKEEPCGNILGMMFHGCLAISNLVCSILTRLVMYPELQEKIFAEIISLRKKTCKQDSNDVQNMHFLLATVYESARLLPPGPLLQRCSLKTDISLKCGIAVPAGAILVVPLQLVQMDNSIWGEDACHFNPHRFLSKSMHQEGLVNEHYISNPDKNGAFLPFGYGTRMCIGQKFAILVISTLFASLLQSYEIRLQPGSENVAKPLMDGHVPQFPNPKIVFIRRTV